MNNTIELVIKKADELLLSKSGIMIAIDGRCAAGKTTLAEALSRHFRCDAVHLDDFFLRPEQRTKQRLDSAGENVDHERFLHEVLIPLRESGSAEYRPFSCKTQSLTEPVTVRAGRVIIVEGSYCCHPALRDFYDLKVFLTVSPAEQLNRITKRNGEAAAERFKSLWIPLEERYISKMSIPEICDIIAEPLF